VVDHQSIVKERVTMRDEDAVANAVDDRLWQDLLDAEVEAERLVREAGLAFVARCRNRPRVLATALTRGYRPTALRLLPGLPEEDRIAVFPILVELAATGHSTIGLVREAILSMSRP
jgi:hypothetical protein